MLILNPVSQTEDNYIDMLEQNQNVIDLYDFPVQFPSTDLLIQKELLKYMTNLAMDNAKGYPFYSRTGYPLFVASQKHLSYTLNTCQATISKQLGLLTFLGFINKLNAAKIPWELINSRRFIKLFGHVSRKHNFYIIPIYTKELLELAEARANKCIASGLKPSIWGSEVIQFTFGAAEAIRTYPKQKKQREGLSNQIMWDAEKFVLAELNTKGLTTKSEIIRFLYSQKVNKPYFYFSKFMKEIGDKYAIRMLTNNQISFGYQYGSESAS